MAYAKMFAIRPGDKLVAYAGFSCVAPEMVVTIEENDGGMFFRCADGLHYLENQRDENGECLGLSHALLL